MHDVVGETTLREGTLTRSFSKTFSIMPIRSRFEAEYQVLRRAEHGEQDDQCKGTL